MILQINKNLKMLKKNQRINKRCVCYGKMKSGKYGWGKPGSWRGRKWKRCPLFDPPIVMVDTSTRQ